MTTYQLPNAGLKLTLDFPSQECVTLDFENVDGPPTYENEHYMLMHGRRNGTTATWKTRILNQGKDFAILEYLKNAPVWSGGSFYTRDYPFCWIKVPNDDAKKRYCIFTQREVDYTNINTPIPPTYSSIGVFKAPRLMHSGASEVCVLSHWQDVGSCCMFDSSNPDQPPIGIKGDILVHAEPSKITDEVILLYYTRIIDTRTHNYDSQYEHGYPTYMTPLIEPPASGPGDWHRPNLCVAEYNVLTNRISKYYHGEFVPNTSFNTSKQLDSGLLNRPAMYGKMFRYQDYLIYTAQSYGSNGFLIFSSSDGILWDFENIIPIELAYHPSLIDVDGNLYFYFCKDRDTNFTFGLRSVPAKIERMYNES